MCIRDRVKSEGVGLMIFSVNFTPNESIQAFMENMDGLEDNILSTEGSKLMACVFATQCEST